SLLRPAAHGDAVRRVGVRRRMGPDRRRRPGSGTGVSRTGARRGRPCPTPARQNATRLPAGQPMTTERPALPAPGPGQVPAHLEKLVETAKDYARGAKAAATQRAYAADWRHYTAWCRRRGLDPALGPAGGRPLSRRLGVGAPCPRPKAERGAHHRAPALGDRLDLRPERPAA